MDKPSGLPDQISPDSLERMPLALVVSDPAQDDCPIVYVNQAFTAVTGYTREETVGRNCRFLQGPNTDPEDRRKIREALSSGDDVSVDIVNYKKNGEEFCNRLLITPVQDQDGAVTHFLGLQHHIKDQSGFAERAADLDNRLRELQHRVKNHLSLVVAMIRLQASRMDPRSASDLLAKRVEAIGLLYEEVDVAGERDGAADIAGYLGKVVDTLQGLSEGVKVTFENRAGDLRLSSDSAARIGLIVSEVLTNAIQHAFRDRDRGEVRVTIETRPDSLMLDVVDDGDGLGDSQWPRDGGLGGQIVLDLASRLDAELDVDSNQTGTRVRLSMPLSQRTA